MTVPACDPEAPEVSCTDVEAAEPPAPGPFTGNACLAEAPQRADGPVKSGAERSGVREAVAVSEPPRPGARAMRTATCGGKGRSPENQPAGASRHGSAGGERAMPLSAGVSYQEVRTVPWYFSSMNAFTASEW